VIWGKGAKKEPTIEPKAEPPQPVDTAGEIRYGMFKVIATCTQCGNPVVVNGPLAHPACPSCALELEIPPDSWTSIVGDLLEDYDELEGGEGHECTLMSGALTIKYSYARLPPPDPACPTCQENWPLETVKTGDDGQIKCTKCGRAGEVFPAPAWLRMAVPEARQIFFGEREERSGAGGTPVEADQAAIKPIALNCPQCAGGLVITKEMERTVPCKYCGIDVYLPDGVWQKLHPARKAKYWMVRFEGPFRKPEED
jgi:ribosomal protein S27E